MSVGLLLDAAMVENCSLLEHGGPRRCEKDRVQKIWRALGTLHLILLDERAKWIFQREEDTTMRFSLCWDAPHCPTRRADHEWQPHVLPHRCGSTKGARNGTELEDTTRRRGCQFQKPRGVHRLTSRQVRETLVFWFLRFGSQQ